MKEMYFEIPLYQAIEFVDDDEKSHDSLVKFINFHGLIDDNNPQLNENTSYQIYFHQSTTYSNLGNYVGYHKRELKCVRTSFTITTYFLLEKFEEDVEDDELITYRFQKVGQFPTIADLEIGKYKKFVKLLSKTI